MDPLEQLMAGQQYQAGDFQRSAPQMQRSTPIDALMGAFDVHKPWGVGDTLSAMMLAVPGAGRPTATIPKTPAFQANNYMEPPPAANRSAGQELQRFKERLKQSLPATPENEAQVAALRAQIGKFEEMPFSEFWGWGNPRAKGIKLVEPGKPPE